MYHVPGIRYDTAAVQSILYHQYLIPEYSYVLPLHFISEKKKRIARKVGQTDSRFRFMHARIATHQGGTSERGDV